MSLFEFDLETDNLLSQYDLNFIFLFGASLMQMEIYNPPAVAGWKAYYQEPSFYRIWLNSSTLPLRKLIIDILWVTGIQVENGVQNRRIDPFKIIEWTDNPADINSIITDVSSVLFTYELTEGQHNFLKDVVLEGLAESDWTEAYVNFQADPDNMALANIIRLRLISLFINMCYLPEYQLN